MQKTDSKLKGKADGYPLYVSGALEEDASLIPIVVTLNYEL